MFDLNYIFLIYIYIYIIIILFMYGFFPHFVTNKKDKCKIYKYYKMLTK